MFQKERFPEIDYLRGFAMLVMILIHTNAYFLSDELAAMLWNYSQFAVPVFLFCSGYIYYRRTLTPEHPQLLQNTMKNPPPAHAAGGNVEQTSVGIKGRVHVKDMMTYIKKRFLRLLIPYYIFACIYSLLLLWKEPSKITFHYLIQTITITGGIDINWLIFLFLILTFLMPVFSFIWNKKKVIFYVYSVIAVLSSFVFLFYKWKSDYRLIMWLPWSLMLIYTMYFVRLHTRKLFYVISIGISAILFFTLLFIEMHLHHSLIFYDNKYPPNAFILSYGIGSTALLFLLAKYNFFSFPPIKQLLHYLSINSYELYFIHYIYLYLISFVMWKWHFNWEVFFLAVLTFSLITQRLLNFARQAFLHNHK